MKRIFASVIIPLLIISFTGCTSCKDKATGKQQKKVEMVQIDTIKKQIEKSIYPLPSSASVIKQLTDYEVGYIIGLTNPPENIKKYFISSKKAINLGAYGADLSYATLYKNKQQVIYYLDAIRSLSNDLNMIKIYDSDLYVKIEKNIDNKEELVKLLEGAFKNIYAYLSENDQQPLALLVVGGAWVEGMFLTTNVSEAAYNAPGFSGVLLEQKKSFEDYLAITMPYATDPSVRDFVKLLDPVKKVYDGLSTSLTEQNIKDIKRVIEGVRDQIIK